jgi:regulator of sirC expression with transglutaminase-like and TPR domain
MVFCCEMLELRELLRDGTSSVPLDVAALQIGSIEEADPDITPSLILLDSYASEFSERVTPATPGDDFVIMLNEYLFEELGFQGNSSDYYDPANSCLQQVLLRRLGIPISLSVVYMEISRRLGRKFHGIGLPGHFIVACDEPDFSAYIDPYHGGTLLTVEECYEMAREATGMPLADDRSMLQPVSPRHIAIRMLNNLRAVYLRRHDPGKAVRVLDLLIEAAPGSAEEYKQRGVCLAQLDRFAEASDDLRSYLRLAPDATDRWQVTAELERLRRLIALQD